MKRETLLATAVLFVSIPVLAASCAPSPKNTPCSNGGECQKVDPKYTYCLESRCVECVGDASCPDQSFCKDGTCRRRCVNSGDCPGDTSCQSGFCGD